MLGGLSLWQLSLAMGLPQWGGCNAETAWEVCWASRCVKFGRDECSSCFLFISTGQDGHQDPLTCVASNQDGSLILTGSVDCHAKLVNSATGKVSPCPPVGRSSGYE